MGSTTIDGVRVYGRKYANGAFGPSFISRTHYFNNRSVLELAPYTREWLEPNFGHGFPDVSFKDKKDLMTMPFETLVILARRLGVDYVNRGFKQSDESEGLAEAILRIVENRK